MERGAPLEDEGSSGPSLRAHASALHISSVGGARMRAPAASSRWTRSGAPAQARSVLTIMTGPASSVESSRADGGVRSRRSKTTRVSGRPRYAPRGVRSGSSVSTVPDPTPMASTSARCRWTRRLAAGPVSRVRTPGAAASRPSRLTAAFRITYGRPRRRLRQEHRVLPRRRVLLHADGDGDAALAQVGQPAAVHERVGILDGDDRAPDAGPRHQRRARPGPAGVRARFQRAVERRAASPRPRVREGDHFGVRSAGHLVRAAPDDHAVVVDDQRADHGIGARPPAPALRERDRFAHEERCVIHAPDAIRVDCRTSIGIVDRTYHFSSNSASTYSSGENGTRSSIASPTPT